MAVIPFQYISKDEQLLSSPQTILLDAQKIIVRGVQTIPVFDPVKVGLFQMTGFFVYYNGVEYGSVSVDPATLYVLLNQCCSGIPGPARIHSRQFSLTFN